MPNHRDRWRHGQSPPVNIFQKSQTVALLSATLFFFDGFREHSLSNFRGYSRKPLNDVGGNCEHLLFKPKFCKKYRKIFLSVGKWNSVRAPPSLKNLIPLPANSDFWRMYNEHTDSLHKISLGYFSFGKISAHFTFYDSHQGAVEGSEHMNPSEHQEKLLEVLCLRRYGTCANLAHEFDACQRTIRYDIEILMRSSLKVHRTFAGYPLLAEKYCTATCDEERCHLDYSHIFSAFYIESRKTRFVFMQFAELHKNRKNQFLIGKVFSYLTVILPDMESAAGGERG